ncbi:DUF6118 family protein [uncultured Lamprocystis sp.]|uniref:DUF6118 family protein n=1 Tax=uncultured Lamprocystis sp. TaxID=543132 RepID=UPI0025E58D24|nr:DUF6118 family protein [uncultured Lamprocystis sp.]
MAVVSQQGGVGKTTTAINLAIALAAAGRTVLLMDLDPQGHAGHALVRGHYDGGGTERILLQASLSRDLIAATEIPDLYLAPAGPGLAGVESALAVMGDSRTRLYQALATLHSLPLRFDHVVIDCPPALGLLTLNALAAAHRVLLPIPCDSVVLGGLPTVLTTISRLRAGLSQPLYGVYLLISMRPMGAATQSLIATMRHDYGRMTLLSEIPYDEQVKEATERGRPLLAHDLTSGVSQAYLSLAAEWLTLSEEGDQPDGSWRLRARQERITAYCAEISKRVEAWLVDPSSLLYDDAREAMRHQDALVLEELFQATPPSTNPRFAQRRWPFILAGLSLLALLPTAWWLRHWSPDPAWRIELGALVIGTDQYWRAGSLLQARSDTNAYRELLFASQLVASNRERLLACGEQVREDDTATRCAIEMPVSP